MSKAKSKLEAIKRACEARGWVGFEQPLVQMMIEELDERGGAPVDPPIQVELRLKRKKGKK